MASCPSCASELPVGARFCMQCGAAIEVVERREERKVVSVVFADLVGFTSRSEQLDVEDVRGTLAPYHEQLRTILERFGGTVEKFIGDAVVAVFGAPTTHEDDAERAVRAALAVRDAIVESPDDLHVRIGVNTGEALVALGAQPLAGEGMVSGDVVNTAARLQTAAPVDGVLVGEATYRATERQIAYAEHDPFEAKGKREPVACFVAVESRSLLPSQARDTSVLVGRHEEVESLVGALRRVRQTSSAQIVTIVGVPGIGKTRLVAELLAFVEAEAELTWWRVGRVLAYGEGVAFSALAEMVKQQAGILDSDDSVVVGEKLAVAVEAVGLEGSDGTWVRNQLAPLVGAAASAPSSGQQEAFTGWRMFLEAVAEEGPTVLVFDDLHWADDALLDFIDELVGRVREVPLLVVCTARPELLERRPGWGGGKTNALTIGVQPLSKDETAELVGSLIDRTLLDVEAEQTLLERAAGNPLYAHEYVRMLVERGASGSAVPETVQGLIAARLDGLSSAEKSLLQDASVLGSIAWLGGICAVGNRDRSGADELAYRLERKQLIRRERRSSVAGETEYVFAHALIRDVAYGQLTRAQRVERHERAAAWLEQLPGDREDRAERVAHHVTTALELRAALGEMTDALRVRGAEVLLAAASQAAARHDHTGVLRHADAALALDPGARTRAALLYRRAVALHEAGASDEKELLTAHEAALAVDDTEAAMHTAYLLSEWAEYVVEDGEATDRYIELSRRLAATLPTGPITILPAYSAAYRLFMMGRYDEAIVLADAEIERAQRAGAETAAALMLGWRGMSRINLHDAEGLQDVRAGIAVLNEHVHPKAATASYNLGEVLLALGLFDEAWTVYLEGRATARRVGNLMADVFLTCGLAQLAHFAGRDDESRALLDGLVGELAESFVLAELARGHLELVRDPGAARAHAARASASAQETQNHDIRADALALAAVAADRDSATPAADEWLDLFVADLRDVGGHAIVGPAIVLAGISLARHERHAELAEAVESMSPGPWRDIASALADRRYGRAAALLDELPCIPWRNLVLELARGQA